MIYFIQAGKNGPIKIGSSDDPEERLSQLQIANPYELKMIWKYTGNHFTEEGIHKKFNHEHIRGEWFRPAQELIDFITGELENEIMISLANSNQDYPDIFITEYIGGKINIRLNQNLYVEYSRYNNKAVIVGM